MIRPESGLVIYTYGSKTEGGTGAGFFFENPALDRSYRLKIHVSVFQAEVFMLLKAPELERKITTESITICSDSRAAFLALHHTKPTPGWFVDVGRLLLNWLKEPQLCLYGSRGPGGFLEMERHELARTGATNEQKIAEVGIGRFLATVKAELEEDLWQKADRR